MSNNVKKILAEKPFPIGISNHNIFKSFQEIKKVFPEIGLPNCEKEIAVDNSVEVKVSARQLLADISNELYNRTLKIDNFSSKNDGFGIKRKQKVNNVKKILDDVRNQLNKYADNFITNANGRITLNLATDVLDTANKVVFKKGEGLFRVLNKMNDILRDGHFLAMKKFEDMPTFKTFSSTNVPASNFKLKFSSDGSDGLWDIATMSMRGISSCQSWGQGNSTHLVGSMVDPFTGILYLTSGAKFNEHGSKMIRRCVVRFVVDETTKKPFIAMERMYPSEEKAALNAFISFLKEKTDDKFNIVYLPHSNKLNVYVPMSKIVGALPTHEQPYRDSSMQYKEDVNFNLQKIKETFGRMSDSFATKVIAAIRSIKAGDVPEASKNVLSLIKSPKVGPDYSYYLYNALNLEISNYFKKFDISKYENVSILLKEAIQTFLDSNLENKISEVIKTTITKIPKRASEGRALSPSKVRNEKFIEVLTKAGYDKALEYFGSEIKKLTVKSKKEEISIPMYTKLLR